MPVKRRQTLQAKAHGSLQTSKICNVGAESSTEQLALIGSCTVTCNVHTQIRH